MFLVSVPQVWNILPSSLGALKGLRQQEQGRICPAWKQSDPTHLSLVGVEGVLERGSASLQGQVLITQERTHEEALYSSQQT